MVVTQWHMYLADLNNTLNRGRHSLSLAWLVVSFQLAFVPLVLLSFPVAHFRPSAALFHPTVNAFTRLLLIGYFAFFLQALGLCAFYLHLPYSHT